MSEALTTHKSDEKCEKNLVRNREGNTYSSVEE
jgi:hypothetical protein